MLGVQTRVKTTTLPRNTRHHGVALSFFNDVFMFTDGSLHMLHVHRISVGHKSATDLRWHCRSSMPLWIHTHTQPHTCQDLHRYRTFSRLLLMAIAPHLNEQRCDKLLGSSRDFMGLWAQRSKPGPVFKPADCEEVEQLMPSLGAGCRITAGWSLCGNRLFAGELSFTTTCGMLKFLFSRFLLAAGAGRCQEEPR